MESRLPVQFLPKHQRRLHNVRMRIEIAIAGLTSLDSHLEDLMYVVLFVEEFLQESTSQYI